jgi:energy-coupling factor transport system permease protein
MGKYGGGLLIPRLGYVPRKSFIHDLDPITKLIALVCCVLLVIIYGGLLFLGMVFVLILALFIASGIGLFLIYRKLRFIMTFGLLIFFSYLIFVQTGEVLASIKPLGFLGFDWSFSITKDGFLGGLEIALRFLTIISLSMLFVSTTDPAKLAHGLMRSGLPYRYGFMLIATLRFIPVFDMEASTVQHAQKARGLDIDKKGIGRIFKLAKYTFVPLLASALTRVDSLTRSMEGRGFGASRKRTYFRQVKVRNRDWILGLGVLVTTVLLLFIKSQGTTLSHLVLSLL